MSRFCGGLDLLDTSPHGRDQDLEWHTQVTAIVVPNPGLSEGQQAIIARDYAMTGNLLLICHRIPLVHYTCLYWPTGRNSSSRLYLQAQECGFADTTQLV